MYCAVTSVLCLNASLNRNRHRRSCCKPTAACFLQFSEFSVTCRVVVFTRFQPLLSSCTCSGGRYCILSLSLAQSLTNIDDVDSPTFTTRNSQNITKWSIVETQGKRSKFQIIRSDFGSNDADDLMFVPFTCSRIPKQMSLSHSLLSV